MRLLALLAMFAFLAPCVSAHADTLDTFAISGSAVTYGMANDFDTVSGSATIDVTTGFVQSIALDAGGVFESGVDAQYGTVMFVGPSAAKFTISGVTLVGFTGDNFNLNGPNDLYVGQLRLTDPSVSTAVTPEPASLLLLCTGLLGIAAFARRLA